MPQQLVDDERLRDVRLSGALPLHGYVEMRTDAGFGAIKIRVKRPYRVLDQAHYATVKILFVIPASCAI